MFPIPRSVTNITQATKDGSAYKVPLHLLPRLMFLLKMHEVISEMAGRCQDHILTLHNVEHNRELKGNDIYACFVDCTSGSQSMQGTCKT